jgi:hypothetical protein
MHDLDGMIYATQGKLFVPNYLFRALSVLYMNSFLLDVIRYMLYIPDAMKHLRSTACAISAT